MAGPAHAQTIFGETGAQLCFERVQAGDPGRVGARQVCERALEDPRLTPRDRAATHVNLGILERRNGDPAAALSHYDIALRTLPGSAELWLNRGAALVSAGRPEEAVEDLTRAIELGLQRPERGYYNRALAHEALSDYASAYIDHQRALEAAPGFTPARRALTRFSRSDASGR
ncbi:MAG: tetratricopeptide repeat protein [Pseudomonadota bacterium]